jgi:hypothetical protein
MIRYQKYDMVLLMGNWADHPTRTGDRTLQLFVPSVDRDGGPVPRGQRYWTEVALELFGRLFGGATAFPPARGVWRDDARGGALVYDDTVIVFSYIGGDVLENTQEEAIFEFIQRLGREGKQGEVGLFIDGTYYGFQDFD